MARKGKIQMWTEYVVVRAVLGALGALPRSAAIRAAVGISNIAYYLLGNLRKTGRKNLEIALPELTEAEHEKIIKGTFRSLGRVLGEVSQFGKATRESLATIADFTLDQGSLDLWDRLRADGRGLVITTGHLGNWELLVFGFAAFYEPMAYLARPLDNPLVEELTVAIRTRLGNRPLNKTNSALTAIKLLRNGEFVGVLADVNAHPKEGVFVPFFGIPACTTAGPATMAIRTNSLLYPIFCVFNDSSGRYELVHGSPIEPSMTGDRDLDIAATTAAYTAEIEKVIRKYPDQWLWIHKRWKTRPKGEGSIY